MTVGLGENSPCPPLHRSAGAFTLIEVLVVVAIIALLIAVLIPSLSRARERARVAACGANIRTSGSAILYYAQANRDYMPPSGAWAELARPYLQRGGVVKTTNLEREYDVGFYKCPSDKILAETGQVKIEFEGNIVSLTHFVSYVLNVHLVWPLQNVEAARDGTNYHVVAQGQLYNGKDALGNPIWTAMRKTAQNKRLSEVVMLADGGDDEVSCNSAYWDFDDQQDFLGPVLEVHHGSGNNFLFADQHIEYHKVLGENVPRRGVPAVPRHWLPIMGIRVSAPSP
jgi:prepilin-type N-terminal cleavage/methylation domain-containing protein